MAGGPPTRNQHPDLRIHVGVTGGGTQTGAILAGNVFQGQVTSRTNYTGPPPREGAPLVAPREQIDETISLRNTGSLSHQTIASGNTFGGNVNFEHNVNITNPTHNDIGEEMDLR